MNLIIIKRLLALQLLLPTYVFLYQETDGVEEHDVGNEKYYRGEIN